MQLIFGIGALWGTRTDISGVGPDQFAVLQNNEIDFSFEVKELYSQFQFPVDIARGKGKITGKAKTARVFGQLYADLFFGSSYSTGEITVAQDEIATLGTSPYTVANSANFAADLGVFYGGSTSGTRFGYSTGAPSMGSYTTAETSGIYTFNTGDVGATVAISYVYNVSAVGKLLTLANNFMGYTPTFAATFYQVRSTFGGKGQLTLRLNQCISSRLTFPSRIDDYGIPDFDWMAMSAGTNTIGTLSTTE